MKTKEKLNALKEEVGTMNKKLAELNEEELLQVTGGFYVPHDEHVFEPPVFEPPVLEPPVDPWDDHHH